MMRVLDSFRGLQTITIIVDDRGTSCHRKMQQDVRNMKPLLWSIEYIDSQGTAKAQILLRGNWQA